MKLGIVQHPVVSDIAENLDSIRHYATSAKKAGCSCVCFPECNLTGYIPERSTELAITREDSIFLEVSLISSSLEMDLLVGFMEKDELSYYITHAIFRPDGSKNFYRKTHLGIKEQLYFSAGDELPVFELSSGVKFGFQLCVETHFPEITKTLALKGAEVIFAPHAVPRISGDRQQIWGKYIPARSYDNRVYMACCNLWDENRFGGGCFVTNPNGEIIGECFDNAPALLTFEVEKRDYKHNFLTRRRPELYV